MLIPESPFRLIRGIDFCAAADAPTDWRKICERICDILPA